MDIINQKITNDYALYNGDCLEVLPSIPDGSVHLSVYSPPFCGLYHYSSSERDMSNCRSYSEFFEHYEYLIREIERVTMPGRMTAVHCMDIPSSCNAASKLTDFPGDIIRMHEKIGMDYAARYHVWKEPLGVRLRTMAKGLAHAQIVSDSSKCDVASADYLLMFRKRGENPVPVENPTGLERYAGERIMPAHVQAMKGKASKQIENTYSHWIWRQYASSFWDDVRLGRVLPYKESRDPEDEKHVHPLQLDVIERTVVLRSNPGETVLTPFMGIGSEAYGAVINNRKAVGIELKSSYYNQAVLNMKDAKESKYEPELDFSE
jgi:DNA modification methylase